MRRENKIPQESGKIQTPVENKCPQISEGAE
jgi:hypothetical protein